MKKSAIRESLKRLGLILLFNEVKISHIGNLSFYLENIPCHVHIHSKYTTYFVTGSCFLIVNSNINVNRIVKSYALKYMTDRYNLSNVKKTRR